MRPDVERLKRTARKTGQVELKTLLAWIDELENRMADFIEFGTGQRLVNAAHITSIYVHGRMLHVEMVNQNAYNETFDSDADAQDHYAVLAAACGARARAPVDA